MIIGEFCGELDSAVAPWLRSRRHTLSEAFGSLHMDELTPHLVRAWMRSRLRERQPGTVNRELSVLRGILAVAVQHGRIPSNPCDGVKSAPEHNMRLRYLRDDEEERLLAALEEPLRSFVVFLLHTGCRLSEATGLRWDEIDAAGPTAMLMRTKTKVARHIPLNRAAWAAVEKQPPNGPVVFSRLHAYLHRKWRAALRRAGIEDLRFHDLRHTFATRLAAKGCDVFLLRDLLGHASLASTSRYAHVATARKVAAVRMLEEI